MLTISAIPAFNDNYIWCVYSTITNAAIIVDPGSSIEVMSFIHKHNLDLKAILITHHHPDHVGGVKQLKEQTGAIVYGSNNSKLDIFDVRVNHEDQIELFSLTFKVLAVPGHTLDHIAFYSDGNKELASPILFCGDTLFSAGCGRLFEGTPEQMLNSLTTLSQLPEKTLVYPAHEYTLANLDFALHLSPNNPDILEYIKHCKETRNQGLATLPTSIKQEKLINPFLRFSEESLKNEVRELYPSTGSSSLDIFTQIRKAKDSY